MRRGELLGLRWVDIDLIDATFTVSQALVEVHGTVIEIETKTPAGNRTITLDPMTVAVLAEHRRRQQRAFACRSGWVASYSPMGVVAMNDASSVGSR